MPKTQQIVVRVDAETMDEINALTHEIGGTDVVVRKSAVIRAALKKGLRDLRNNQTEAAAPAPVPPPVNEEEPHAEDPGP